MNRLTHLLEDLLEKLGLHGIVPTGTMPPDNTEIFDNTRLPEQYAEYVDVLFLN